MPRFPSPTGPYSVGTAICRMTDMSRSAHVLRDDPGRALFIRVWYPAEHVGAEPEILWSDLRATPGLPPPMRLLMSYLRNVRTSSCRDAPYARNTAPRGLVVYSHALISFAAENTALTEDLASHGYIVVALQHLEQLAEFQALSRRQTAAVRKADRAMAAKLKRFGAEERAKMARSYYEGAANTNWIATARACDIAYALDHREEILAAIPGFPVREDAPAPVLLAGFSLGGAASTEFVRATGRGNAVANIDGGLYGAHIGRPISVPYLMLYSAVSEGINDALLPSRAVRITAPGAAHLNFHDIAMLLPILRLFGATGGVDARDVIARRNTATRDFFASVS